MGVAASPLEKLRMKALVIETAFLGDAILSVALAEALKQSDPSAEVSYLVRPESRELLQFATAIDHVIAYDKYGAESGLKAITNKADELNRIGFDIVFALHESQRTGMLLEKLTAPRKIGYGKFSSLTDHATAPAAIQRSARSILLLRPLYPNVDLKVLPKLDVSAVPFPDELKDISAPIAVIAPGSVWKTKRWPPTYFASAAEQLVEREFAVVFIGSSQDVETMKEVKALITTPHINLVGKTTIAQAAVVISRSKFLLANDSAPVHMATALGVPSVVVFGPTVREFGFAPPIELGTVVEHSTLWCRPCTSHGSNDCPIHTHECMTGIVPEQVLSQIGRFAEFNGT
jgi:heptosyltransferase II